MFLLSVFGELILQQQYLILLLYQHDKVEFSFWKDKMLCHASYTAKHISFHITNFFARRSVQFRSLLCRSFTKIRANTLFMCKTLLITTQSSHYGFIQNPAYFEAI